MKSNLFFVLAVLSIGGLLLLSGCVNQQAAPSVPSVPSEGDLSSVDAVDELTAGDDVTGITPTELDELQSDFDELDSEVSGVSETDI